MLKTPAAVPPFDPSRADMRLPDAALKLRTDNGLLTDENLRRLNITAWLYRNKDGVEGIQVNPNTTIAELLAQFGPADTRDAEVGIHSEGRAAEFFRTHPDLQVLQIFTERIPCAAMCAPLLAKYFPGVPVFFYYDRRTWGSTRSAGEILRGIYGGAAVAAAATLTQFKDQFDRMNNLKNLTKGEHRAQLSLIRNSWNPMGRVVQAFNPADTPELTIWDGAEQSLNEVRRALAAGNVMRSAAFLIAADKQNTLAIRKFATWKDGFEAGANRANTAIVAAAAVAILAAVAVFAAGAAVPAVEGATALANAEQTLVRIGVLSERVDQFIRVASSEEEVEEVVEQLVRAARLVR